MAWAWARVIHDLAREYELMNKPDIVRVQTMESEILICFVERHCQQKVKYMPITHCEAVAIDSIDA